MNTLTNTELCALAQAGSIDARDLLLENMLPEIRKLAGHSNFTRMPDRQGLGVDTDDLIQEGCIALLKAIDTYDSSKADKFEKYAGTVMSNVMNDLIRSCRKQYEQRMVEADHERIRLDGICFGDDTLHYSETISHPLALNPEQIYIMKETLQELHAALRSISARERSYLHYRYGFIDDMEHTLKDTAAHFHLTVSRARNTERKALGNVRCHIQRF